ncbi:MAG TPA: radical SAM protein, partial [Chthonomonadales bacterium]|nr:radical SAM protein [Chthonomonadales bacterium]
RFAAAGLGEVAGLTWKDGEQVIHNPERRIHGTDSLPPLNYARLQDVAGYLRPSFMGARTAVHQAAVGCRYHCDFCGVVSMFNGKTVLQAPRQLELALTALRDRYGATAVQFYDNNFFDREPTSIPTLELLAKAGLPWWCYARADTLAKFSAATWQLICKSRLKMAYIGVESASDEALTRMRKGTKVEHTVEVAHRCREAGIVPEFSFILGGPEDPEGEIEATFRFIRKLKAINPGCEVILYFYSPTPQRHPAMRSQGRTPIPRLAQYGPAGPELPETPEEWTQPQWISYVCHQDAPWLTEAIRRRVRDFAQVLSCRFPTAQDYRTPWWGKLVLRELARPRYAQRRYGKPWELSFARRIIPLRDPATESL